MTEFYIKNLDKWLHQNRADIIEIEEGCLNDNYVAACKRGYAFIYQRFVNTWTSKTYVKFAPYSDIRTVQDLWEEWYAIFDSDNKCGEKTPA